MGDRKTLFAAIEEKRRRQRTNRVRYLFPDQGYEDRNGIRIDISRRLYPKHLEFFRLGKRKRVRVLMAANRVGKTVGACTELVYHLTGRYPSWWDGKTFSKEVRGWAASDTMETTRDGLQMKLMGPVGEFGTGLIPADAIADYKFRRGSADALDWVKVKNERGGSSVLGFKSYDQGWRTFQAVEREVILLDEEPDPMIFSECVKRTATTGGTVMMSYTPLRGLTPLTSNLLNGSSVDEEDDASSRAIVTITWDDVPHLLEADKREVLESLLPHQIDAATKGVPGLGSGAVFPVAESLIKIDPFPLPNHWPRVYALDVGWNKTAALFGAIDRETDTLYLYSEHYMGQAQPEVHAGAIMARGNWIPGVIDDAAKGSMQDTGANLFGIYRKLGLNITPTKGKNREAGIHETLRRLGLGQIKVFSTLSNFFEEYRLYRRNEHGKVVEDTPKRDHLMDDLRYLVTDGLAIAKTKVMTALPSTQEQTYGIYS